MHNEILQKQCRSKVKQINIGNYPNSRTQLIPVKASVVPEGKDVLSNTVINFYMIDDNDCKGCI